MFLNKIISLSFFMIQTVNGQYNNLDQFISFQNKFSKTYKSNSEMILRSKIFEYNLKKITFLSNIIYF